MLGRLLPKALLLCCLFVAPCSAFGWGDDGHQIVAYIAAANLNDSARKHIATILGVASDPGDVADAMAKQAIRPDREFRPRDKSTAPWHFVDLCLQDTEGEISKRCNRDQCP